MTCGVGNGTAVGVSKGMGLMGYVELNDGSACDEAAQVDYYTREVQELLAWCERVNKGQLESSE